MRFYPGRRIGEWWRGEMTSRELLVMVNGLPQDSATRLASSGDPWTTTEHFLANIQDAVTFSRADWANYHGGNMTPEAVKRPGAAAKREAVAATARLMHDQMMAAMGGRPTS